MRKKKILSGFLSLALASVLSVSGCSSSDSSSKSSEEEASSAAPSQTLSPEPEETETSSLPDESTGSETDSSEPDDTEGTDITPPMWEDVSPEGARVVFIGSLHALKDECYPLPKIITDAYDSADVLAVECDAPEASSNYAFQLKQSEALFYSDGTTFEDHLDPEVSENLKGYLEYMGFDPTRLKNYKLWALSTMAETMLAEKSGLDFDIGLDEHLLGLAHSDGKEIFEIESVDLQLDMYLSISDEIYGYVLSSYSADMMDLLIQSVDNVYDCWKKGDIEAFDDTKVETFIAENEAAGITVTDHDIDIFNEYNSIFLFDRNVGMKEKAEELMNSGKNVLYIVGASHFPGEKGLISLLEQDGYTLRQISPQQ